MFVKTGKENNSPAEIIRAYLEIREDDDNDKKYYVDDYRDN
jgi:hypothetical protein